MSPLARQLTAHRTTRNAARSAFDSHLAQVRADLNARGVGGRLADRAADEASAMMGEAAEVARNERGIIAGTIAAVAVWIFRKPIFAWIQDFLGEEEGHEADDGQD